MRTAPTPVLACLPTVAEVLEEWHSPESVAAMIAEYEATGVLDDAEIGGLIRMCSTDRTRLLDERYGVLGYRAACVDLRLRSIGLGMWRF